MTVPNLPPILRDEPPLIIGQWRKFGRSQKLVACDVIASNADSSFGINPDIYQLLNRSDRIKVFRPCFRNVEKGTA